MSKFLLLRNAASLLVRKARNSLSAAPGAIANRYWTLPEQSRSKFQSFLLITFVIVGALAARPTFMQSLGRSLVFNDYASIWTKKEARNLQNNNFPGGRAIEWVRNNLPEESKTLVYRQAEFSYYVNTNWVYDFDPKIMKLYELDGTKKAAHEYLIDQGITHIFVPNYMPATLYNGAVSRLIGDPAFTEEVVYSSGMRLYKLLKTQADLKCVQQDSQQAWFQGVIGGSSSFETEGSVITGGRVASPKTFTVFDDTGNVLSGRKVEAFGSSVLEDGRFNMIWPENSVDRVGILSGYGPLYMAPTERFDPKEIDAVYSKFEVSGKGMLEVWVYEYDENDAVSSRRVWDAVLSSDKGSREVEFQVNFDTTTRSYRLLFVNGGTAEGYAVLSNLRLCGRNTDRDNFDSSPLAGAKQLVTNFDLSPSRNFEESGARLYLGSSCYRFSRFCREFDPSSPSLSLLLQESLQKSGVSATLPIDNGYIISSGPLDTTLGTYWQCRFGRAKWFLERSPARNGFFEYYFLKFYKARQPAGNQNTDRAAELNMSINTPPNTIITGAVLWKDEDGKPACYYLGEQVIKDEQDLLKWSFPLPNEYSELQYAFEARHPVNDYSNFDVGSLTLFAGEAGTGLLPDIRRSN